MSTECRDKTIDKHRIAERTPAIIMGRDELKRTRKRGYATNEEERNEGFFTITAPITYDETVFGSINVSAPNHPMEKDGIRESIQTNLLDATNQVGLNIRCQVFLSGLVCLSPFPRSIRVTRSKIHSYVSESYL